MISMASVKNRCCLLTFRLRAAPRKNGAISSIRIKGADSRYFPAAWRLYKAAFPPNERRCLPAQKKLLGAPNYNFYAIAKNAKLVGIIASWNLGEFLFIEHFTVAAKWRGKGIGAHVLDTYINTRAGKGRARKKTILEAEPPRTALSKRRVRFYEDAGFAMNLYAYVQPPYDKNKNPLRMRIMSRPGKLDKREFGRARELLYSQVYGIKRAARR